MPITYQIDAPQLLVCCSASGVVSLGELEANQKKLAADPAFTFKETARVLWDFSAVTRLDHSVGKVVEVAESWMISTQSRRALVAQPDSQIAKMLSVWVLHRAARGDANVQLFGTIAEGRQWLAQPA